MEATVSAAIVTYNRLNLLKKTLKKVLEQEYKNLKHIIVVDNNSDDGTEKYIKSIKDKRLIYKKLDKNIGGSGGFNKAVRFFIEDTKDEYIWMMDDDTFSKRNSLSELIKNVDSSTGLLASKVLWQGKELSKMNLMKDSSGSFKQILDDTKTKVPILNATFVSVLIRRNEITKVGLPQKEYFIWGDDIEFTERITRISKGYLIKSSVVDHMSSENIHPGDIANENNLGRLPRYYFEYRNRVLTARRRKSLIKIIKTLGHSFLDLIKVIFSPKSKYKIRKIYLIIKGTWSGLFFNPQIESLN